MKCMCGQLINENRTKAGYIVCLICGDKQAKHEVNKRKQYIGLAYNKGPIMLLASNLEKAKDAMLDAGRKTRSTDTSNEVQTCGMFEFLNRKTRTSKPLKKIIGTMWIDDEAYAVYNRDDPRLSKAQRKVFY